MIFTIFAIFAMCTNCAHGAPMVHTLPGADFEVAEILKLSNPSFLEKAQNEKTRK
jgi:hypothetical protein